MIKAGVLVLIVALVLGVLGFGGLVGVAVGIVKLLFWIAVVIAAILFILGFTVYRAVT